MTRALRLAVFLIAIAASGPVGAVDAARVYNAAPALPVASSWTGLYVGGAVGEKWQPTTWTATSLRDPPGIPPAVGTILPIDASSPGSYDPAGFRAGVYLGYTWQIRRLWVVGLEGDFGHARGSVNASGFPGCAAAPCTTPNSGVNAPVDTTSLTMRWDASARARLGYLLMPNLLLYGTGGVAWQNDDVSGTCGPLIQSFYCNGVKPLVPGAVTNNSTFTGWTLGGGLEWKVYEHWLVRGEYRFADFGTHQEVFALGFSKVAGDNTYRYQLLPQTHIATFGLAYKF
jgi:outer membrane immunogenic protein